MNNAFNITLTGTASKIVNQSQANTFANFASNETPGSFTLAGGRTFTTVGNFTDAGVLHVSTDSTFTVAANHSYTETATQQLSTVPWQLVVRAQSTLTPDPCSAVVVPSVATSFRWNAQHRRRGQESWPASYHRNLPAILYRHSPDRYWRDDSKNTVRPAQHKRCGKAGRHLEPRVDQQLHPHTRHDVRHHELLQRDGNLCHNQRNKDQSERALQGKCECDQRYA